MKQTTSYWEKVEVTEGLLPSRMKILMLTLISPVMSSHLLLLRVPNHRRFLNLISPHKLCNLLHLSLQPRNKKLEQGILVFHLFRVKSRNKEKE